LASAQIAIEPVSNTRRSMREPSVASVGAQIAAEIPNAAISNPAFSIGIASEAEMSLSRPPTLRKLVATKKLPAMRTMRREKRHSGAEYYPLPAGA
jgi:hypothetical protein